jgi:hypothetical protein
MSQAILGFGETRPEFAIPVLNERAVRASAGILFVFALVSFMNAWLTGNFQPTRLFVLAFLADFSIRLFVNPRYSPSFMLGQWMVRNQQPEWVGAPQKRFAWAIGFVLALVMTYLVVFKGVVGPVNILICGACLTLMFFESAFGICVGCKVYNAFNKERAQLCPGGVCAVDAPRGARLSAGQLLALALYAGLVVAAGSWVATSDPYAPRHTAADSSVTVAPSSPVDVAEAERCKVPEFAKRIGHEEKWKLHNNCK